MRVGEIKMVMLCDKVDKGQLPQFLNVVNESDWVAETKEDGDRVRLMFDQGNVRLTNRRYRDVTATYPELHNFDTPHFKVFLDGEMCVFRDGISQFNEGIAFRSHCKSPSTVKAAMAKYPVTFVVFDILELDGEDLRGKPYAERRKYLEALELRHPNVIVAEQFCDIKDAWDKVEKSGAEGLILKHKNSLYREGYRSSNWRKVKNIKETDLKFTKYEVNPQGITVENSDGHRCLVAGRHQHEVKRLIDLNGEAEITIRHLGQTKAGRYRQPVYMKVVK